MSYGFYIMAQVKEKKEDIWLGFMTKTLKPTENSKQSKVTTQKRHQKFDYTAIADGLRTVSWRKDRHVTGVVKQIYVISIFPLTGKAV